MRWLLFEITSESAQALEAQRHILFQEVVQQRRCGETLAIKRWSFSKESYFHMIIVTLKEMNFNNLMQS